MLSVHGIISQHKINADNFFRDLFPSSSWRSNWRMNLRKRELITLIDTLQLDQMILCAYGDTIHCSIPTINKWLFAQSKEYKVQEINGNSNISMALKIKPTIHDNLNAKHENSSKPVPSACRPTSYINTKHRSEILINIKHELTVKIGMKFQWIVSIEWIHADLSGFPVWHNIISRISN